MNRGCGILCRGAGDSPECVNNLLEKPSPSAMGGERLANRSEPGIAAETLPMQQSIIIDAPAPVFHVLPPDEGHEENPLEYGLIASLIAVFAISVALLTDPDRLDRLWYGLW